MRAPRQHERSFGGLAIPYWRGSMSNRCTRLAERRSMTFIKSEHDKYQFATVDRSWPSCGHRARDSTRTPRRRCSLPAASNFARSLLRCSPLTPTS